MFLELATLSPYSEMYLLEEMNEWLDLWVNDQAIRYSENTNRQRTLKLVLSVTVFFALGRPKGTHPKSLSHSYFFLQKNFYEWEVLGSDHKWRQMQ